LTTLKFDAKSLRIAILAALALPAAAGAEPLTYGVDVGVGETDNVTLVPTDKVSQTIALTDLDFAVKQQTRLLDLAATGNFSYLDYLQNAYANQLIGRFDGTAHVALIPERLTWVVQDDFGQSALDPFTPTTPDNLENVNYLSTGPDLALRLGGTGFVNFSARVARAQYETSPFNSNRVLGNLAAGLQLTANSSVSLNGDTERVLFTNTVVNTDFDRTNAFVRYQVQGARTEFSADLGATTISQGGASTSGGLGRVKLSRKVSTAATLTLSAGRVLTDASTSFSNLQSGATGVVGTAPAAQTSNNYTSDYASAEWQYKHNRTTIAVSGHWEKDVYGGEPSLDYTRGGVELRVERTLTHALSAQLVGHFYKTNYENVVVTGASGSADYNDGLIGASLVWRHGRGLEVRLRCEHSSRVATGFENGYSENRAYLTVGYRPSPAQPSVVQPDEAPGA
jgi:hypothetical protein